MPTSPNISHRETEATSCSLAVWRHVPDEARVKIEDMNEEDAISLLLKSASLDKSRTELREAARPIVKELLFLPLAVHQAGASIASGLCYINDYLRIYSQHRQKLLADPTFKGASNYGLAVHGTRDLSLTAINAQTTEAAFLDTSLIEMDFKKSGFTIVTLSGCILYTLVRAVNLVLASISLSDLLP